MYWLALGALIATLVNWLFLPPLTPYEAYRAIRGAFSANPAPPPLSQRIVTAYVRETREASFWQRPPTVFPPSVARLRAEFRDFDPRRAHSFRDNGLRLWIPDVIHEAPVFAGAPVEVIGRIVAVNVLRPVPPPNVEWVLQLQPVTVENGLIYCRLTAPISTRFSPGEHWVVRGVVLAAGNIALMRGGSAPGVYMACSAARRPRGSLGEALRFVERARIDLVSLYRKARSESEFRRAYARAVSDAVQRDPSLVPALPPSRGSSASEKEPLGGT